MAFPDSFRLSCTKYIRNNLKAFLTDYRCMTLAECKQFLGAIFDSKGLLEIAANHVEMKDALT